MFERLEAADREWRAALADLDPRALIGTQPAEAIDLVIKQQRATAAAKAALMRRVDEMLQWKRQGYDSFEEWLAATEGTSTGRARRKAKAARDMADNDKVADALADGDISEDEAEVVADAAAKNPDATDGLLDTAKNKHKTHSDLKDQAADAKAAGETDQERAQRLRRGRSARCGKNPEGFWTLFAQLQPHVGAAMKAHLDAETDRQFDLARKAGLKEPEDRYRADALARLILGHQPDTFGTGADPTTDTASRAPATHPANESAATNNDGCDDRPDPGTSAEPDRSMTMVHKELILDINLQTIRRGNVESGETCSIRGVGPVPVEVARQWLDDAFIKAVIRDGTEIKTVVHYGRNIPAVVRTALGVIDQTCAVPGCSNRRTQYDHEHTVADDGPSSADNLRPLCIRHHRLRTHHNYELEGPPGDRRWLDPNGAILFADDPERIKPNDAPGQLFDPETHERTTVADPPP